MIGQIDPALIPPAPTLEYEKNLWLNRSLFVAGLDEAGRGAWAGPVSAAAVILPVMEFVPTGMQGVRDSKQISASARTRLSAVIKSAALDWAVGLASSEEVDELGILPATRLAMMRALQALANPPDHLLIDALFLPDCEIPQSALVKGDQRSLSIAAASILAKTTRDDLMIAMALKLPGYGLDRHKGYGTKAHRQALDVLGPSPIHRASFKPIKDRLNLPS